MKNSEDKSSSFPLYVRSSLPLKQHTASTLISLIEMIYSRGEFLSRVTGGKFYVSRDLMDALKDARFRDIQDVVAFIKEHNSGIAGLVLDDKTITFTGIRVISDAEQLQAFMKLFPAMNMLAITQKRIEEKECDNSSLSAWLMSLGMTEEEIRCLLEKYTRLCREQEALDIKKSRMRCGRKKVSDTLIIPSKETV